ncbi:MAG: FdhF/YdeP family oxidoreductase, partial [Luteimonas sp.]
MPGMADDTSIHPYDKAAGGWDALKSSWQALRDQQVVLKGSSTLLRTNQDRGFDCPGCAWPDRNAHSTFEFCENGVKAVANEATSRRIMREFFAMHPVGELATWNDHDLEALGRLTEPMAYDAASDCYVPIAWDDAFANIAAALNALASPDEAIFYTSGRTSNEAAFLYQLFVREFGTNNLPDCSNMCHEPSGVAMGEQVGSGKGSVLLEDFELAEAIFIFGQNPGTNHPRMLGELRNAAKRGCHIVAVNPLRERGLERFADPKSPSDMLRGDGSKIASQYLQPRIGGDLAVAAGIAKMVVERDAIDHAFIDMHTSGFGAYAASLRGLEWGDIERESGLSRGDISQAADVYIASNATIFCWGMGITQHRRSVATIQMLVNLLLLRGNIGKDGAGPCPVRGHSNVQGDRTMGIYEKMGDAFLDKLGAAFNFAPPRTDGFDTIAAIEAMRDGHASVFFAMGGNFAAATPDTVVTQQALRNCTLTVHVSTKLNRSHLVHGRKAMILPCLGRTEIDLQANGPQAVTVEDSMSMVHLSSGMNPPASEQLLSEPAIVARLAVATLPDSKTPWLQLLEDYDRIRDRIALVVDGFEQFNARVRAPGGFHLHHPNRERAFPTIDGKARFYPHALVGAAPGATP